jgi:hypothetical protein
LKFSNHFPVSQVFVAKRQIIFNLKLLSPEEKLQRKPGKLIKCNMITHLVSDLTHVREWMKQK